MEDYFHLNLKKFVAEISGNSEDVKPNAAALPSQAAKTASTQQHLHPADEQTAPGIDNTDPYNSTGRFNLKTADG